nr:hypothetical protein [Tanacetum cinerariifolium]
MLSSFLISQDFSKGSVDPTLFIRRNDNDLLLVQIYVDDIIFAASTPELCDLFANLIGYSNGGEIQLDEDKEGKVVDPSHYHGMIGTLLYLTTSRHDLQFAIYTCARYQARPTKKHVHAVKRIFRYLHGTVHQGLWYPKDSSVALTAFADADHDDIKSKESTLQLVYDVLRLCPFFKAFLVIADVPEIDVQEFWVTATVYHHAIRFKMDNKKHIVNLESFRDMLHICPRVHELTNEEIRNTNAYKEYYAIATRAAPPKPKASVRRTRSSSDTTITPPTAAAGPRLTNSQKGKQAPKAFKAKSLSALSEKIIKELVKEQVKVQVSKILPRIEQTVNEQLEAKVLTLSSHSSKTSYAVAANLSEMELKKILTEKIEGNKETVTLKRRHDDDADKDEEPFTRPDRGSKRRKEGKEPESASAPLKTATRSAGRLTQVSQSRQTSASEYDFAEEPMQTTCQMEEPSHPEFDTCAED